MESLFNTLIENILLTETQKEDAQKKYNGVCETLHNNYYPDTKYNGSTKLLIGSYGKSTNIRPPRDVDVIFKIPEDEFARFDSLSGNKQSQLLQEIRSILKDTYTTTEKIKAFGKVVSIEFADGTHNVELLPSWQLSDGKFRIPNTENGGSWETYDAMFEIDYVSSSNKRTGKTLDVIRICKKWVEYCNVPLESFVVELQVIEYLDTLIESTLKEGYSHLITGFLQFLITRTNTIIYSPAGKIIFLGDGWKSRAESAYQKATKALKYENDDELDKAADEWKKLFGDDFPKFEKKSLDNEFSSDMTKSLVTQFPSQREKFLDRDCGIGFRISPSYQVSIDAQITQDGFRPGWLSSFLKQRYPLKKNKKLLFAIQRNNVPSPYLVKWKVRNFGDEAKNHGDLRGEISDDLGDEEKVERTKYFGEHYVECYIIKDGYCVAMDKILVPIGNDY